MSTEETETKTPKVHNIWERRRVITDVSSKPSLTKSEYRDECNINNVIARALRTGVLPGVKQEALYGDFTEVTDYATAQVKIAEAKSEFEQLPSHIKEKFDNEVTTLLDWMDDPANEDEARKLGLLPKLEVENTSTETVIDEQVSESNQNQDSNTVDS